MTDSQERWSIVKCSDRSQILFRGPEAMENFLDAALASFERLPHCCWPQPFLLLLPVMGTFGVGPTGSEPSGVATDQTGAAVRDVAVTIKSARTLRATRTTPQTDVDAGHYQASGLPPGRFEIRAAKQGVCRMKRARESIKLGGWPGGHGRH